MSELTDLLDRLERADKLLLGLAASYVREALRDG